MKEYQPVPGSEQSGDAAARDRARMILLLRKRRPKYFNAMIFGEPAWDTLLHLFVHDHEGDGIDVDVLADLADTSPLAMLRWLAILMEEQLVKSVSGDAGGNGVMAMTEHGRQAMMDLLSL